MGEPGNQIPPRERNGSHLLWTRRCLREAGGLSAKREGYGAQGSRSPGPRARTAEGETPGRGAIQPREKTPPALPPAEDRYRNLPDGSRDKGHSESPRQQVPQPRNTYLSG